MTLLLTIIMSLNLLITPKTAESAADREARVRKSYWLPTQERWIKSKSRKKIMAKCRRFGGSYAEAYAAVERTSMEGCKYDSWVGSRDMLAARLFINDCKKWARTLAPAAQDMGSVLISDPKEDLQAFAVKYANGRQGYSLSSSPDAFAGKQGRFTFDEAALHKDLRLLYAIAQPAIMRGGSMSFISTHRGRLNYFNTLVEEIKHKGNPKKFELFEINIIDAVREGLWIKIRQDLPDDDERKSWTEEEFLQSLRDECPDEEAWLQEYMATPADDAAALLTWEDIIACSMSDLDKAALNAVAKDRPRFLGYDVARRKHLSVIHQWVEVNGMLLPERVVVMEKWKFSRQEELLYSMMEDSSVRKVCIDATGLGMQLAERAEERFGTRAQGITLSAPMKLKLAVQMQRRFQDRSLRIDDDRMTHYDFFSVKKEITAGDNILLRSEAGETDGHADRFWAAALGIEAAQSSLGPFTVQGLHLPRGGNQRHIW